MSIHVFISTQLCFGDNNELSLVVIVSKTYKLESVT